MQQMSKGMKNGREEYRKNEYRIVPKDEKKQKKRIKREKNGKITEKDRRNRLPRS